jgi:hypothetical protein
MEYSLSTTVWLIYAAVGFVPTLISMISSASGNRQPIYPAKPIHTQLDEYTMWNQDGVCGNSADIARDRGCRFELATGTWQPPQCFSNDEDHIFRHKRPWKFFRDQTGTVEVTLAELESTRAVLWTTWEFHLWRCAYLWKRDVLVANRNISGDIGGRQHCVDNALLQETRHGLSSIIVPYQTRFSSCQSPPDFIVL